MTRKLITTVKTHTLMRYEDALQLQHLHGTALEEGGSRRAKLIFLQHLPVFTLGRRTAKEHLLYDAEELGLRTGADVVEADRGGSVTYHGPGQLMAYLLLNLRAWDILIHQHLAFLEAAAIKALAPFGIQGRLENGMTGVWVDSAPQGAKKICAIGVGARRWVTYHGLCLNVDLDLKPFSAIVPCGLTGKGVTTMANELGHGVEMSAVEKALAEAVGAVYGAEVEGT
jgi:lipoate-protein ligase B